MRRDRRKDIRQFKAEKEETRNPSLDSTYTFANQCDHELVGDKVEIVQDQEKSLTMRMALKKQLFLIPQPTSGFLGERKGFSGRLRKIRAAERHNEEYEEINNASKICSWS